MMRIRIITTGSSKHAIQVVTKIDRDLVIHKHFGTYVTELEKRKLVEQATEYIRTNTHQANLFSDPPETWTLADIQVINSQPLYLYNLLCQAYDKLGFGGDPLITHLTHSLLTCDTVG